MVGRRATAKHCTPSGRARSAALGLSVALLGLGCDSEDLPSRGEDAATDMRDASALHMSAYVQDHRIYISVGGGEVFSNARCEPALRVHKRGEDGSWVHFENDLPSEPLSFYFLDGELLQAPFVEWHPIYSADPECTGRNPTCTPFGDDPVFVGAMAVEYIEVGRRASHPGGYEAPDIERRPVMGEIRVEHDFYLDCERTQKVTLETLIEYDAAADAGMADAD
jgi:hypothetical protein